MTLNRMKQLMLFEAFGGSVELSGHDLVTFVNGITVKYLVISRMKIWP